MTFYRLQYLILRRDGDGMGQAWPAAANASFEWARESGVTAGVAMPAPYAAPFREMIAAPQVVHRLEWIMGAGFCTGSDFGVRTLHRGEGRQLIHAGLNYKSNEYHYVLTEGGRSYAEAVNVSFQLSDSCTGGGGLTLVSAPTSQSVKIVLHLTGPSGCLCRCQGHTRVLTSCRPASTAPKIWLAVTAVTATGGSRSASCTPPLRQATSSYFPGSEPGTESAIGHLTTSAAW